MQIIKIKMADIMPYENNVKLHPKEQIEQIKKSIVDFGNNDPIAVDENNVIIEEHGRYEALKELGYEEAECIVLTGLTEDQKNAYRLVHNKLTMNSDFDMKGLEEELNKINMDLTAFDFDPFNMDEEEKEIIEDEAPEVDEENEPITKLGDIWELGRHRLMCGDSTDKATVELLMNGKKADMVFTDPPYNMSDNLSGFVSDEMKTRLDKIVDFRPETMKESIFSINTKNFFLFTSKELIPRYFEIFKDYGFNILVWCKDNPTPMTNNTFLPDVEYLLYFYKNGRIWNNGLDVSYYKKYYNSNKLEGRKEAGNVHPTIKPIKIIADKIQICSKNKGIVVDIFGGSGSTLIACEQLDRTCYMMELDPKYCDVIIKRWETLTGKKAKLIKEEK